MTILPRGKPLPAAAGFSPVLVREALPPYGKSSRSPEAWSAAALSTQSCKAAMGAVLTPHKTQPRAKSRSWTSLIEQPQQETVF